MLSAHTGKRATPLAKSKNFVCDQCGKKCATQTKLNSHMVKKHPTVREFKCNQCEAVCKSEKKLRKHMESHQPCKYVCTECGKKCKSASKLNKHIKSKHNLVLLAKNSEVEEIDISSNEDDESVVE
jgi:ribosomal protein L31